MAVTDEQSKEVGDSEAATGQPAATRKKKSKKKSKRGDIESVVLVENQGHVKKNKRSKKAEGASEKQASKPVTLLGLDAADAPWANEPVPEDQHVPHHPAQTLKSAKQEPPGLQGKSQLEGVKSVASAPSHDQALALLGYGAAKKPLSQSKKHKSRHAS